MEKKEEYQTRNVEYKGKNLDVSLFGTNTFAESDYVKNIQKMQKANFRPATIAESISIAAHNFENYVKPIFDSSLLQAGYIVRTSDGVFVNPPRDSLGNLITDEKILKSFLKSDKKVNGIYLLDNEMGFAPYDDSFRESGGFHDSEKFAKGALARVLEHTHEKTAENLRAISEFFGRRIYVRALNANEKPSLRILTLSSGGNPVTNHWLSISGYDWDGGSNGYAFGVKK